MNRCWIIATAACLFGCSNTSNAPVRIEPNPGGVKEITFEAADHHKVYADLYPAVGSKSKGLVLMFHQAGSNAGEYASIAPSITALGFDCIAVDQRSGGNMWGRTNRTVKQSGSGEYLDAYNDLVGAFNYGKEAKYTSIIVWGSSYSASLVLKLASENPTIKAVVTFSPGEYMDDKSIVKNWASKVTMPVFFACTPDELNDGRQQIYDAVPSKLKVLVDLPDGVHGSSTLIPEKSKSAGQYMAKLKAFLAQQTM